MAWVGREALKAGARLTNEPWGSTPTALKNRVGQLDEYVQPGEPGYTGEVIRHGLGLMGTNKSERFSESNSKQEIGKRLAAAKQDMVSAVLSRNEKDLENARQNLVKLSQDFGLPLDNVSSEIRAMLKAEIESRTIPKDIRELKGGRRAGAEHIRDVATKF
jgi:hypothetical protein